MKKYHFISFWGGAALIVMVCAGLRAEVTINPEMTKDMKRWLPKLSTALTFSAVTTTETPAVPKVTIETTSCRFTEEEPTASEYADYKENRYCRLPLPVGAVVTRITAYMVSDEREDSAAFIYRMLDDGKSSARFIVVSERLVDDYYMTAAVPCTSTGVNSGYMVLHERKKTFDCPVGIPVDGNGSFYVRIESQAKVKPEALSTVMISKDSVFPIVRLLQVEYEMTP